MVPYLLHHLVDIGAADPGRTALRHGGRRVLYGEFAASVDAIAGALRAAGLRRGDRVAVLLPKGIEECFAVFAASRADGVLVPINPGLKPQQVRHILADCGVRVLLTNASLLGPLAAILADLDSLTAVLSLDGPMAGQRRRASRWSRSTSPPAAPMRRRRSRSARIWRRSSTRPVRPGFPRA